MPSRERWIEPRRAIIAVGFVAIIVYGSLYPFEFYDNPDVHGPFRDLIATWRTPTNRDDVIANILLYIPFGFFSVQSTRRLPTFILILFVVFVGAVLSVVMELTQLYDLGRYSTMVDVYANTTGTLLGASFALVLRRAFRTKLVGGEAFRGDAAGMLVRLSTLSVCDDNQSAQILDSRKDFCGVILGPGSLSTRSQLARDSACARDPVRTR